MKALYFVPIVINDIHSNLKRSMRRFNGVATKYLSNYLKWFKRTGKYYFVLKYINLLLLLGYIPILIISPTVTFKYYFWGVFLLLFAFIEFINYFLFRLSYKNVGILISQIKTRNLRKSKLAKEIEVSRL